MTTRQIRLSPAAWVTLSLFALALAWDASGLDLPPARLAVSVLLGARAVSLLKAGSDTSCPWELGDFGGLVPYASHWSLRPDSGSGHCFPAGHASAGFSFVGGYFAFRGSAPRVARLWLAAAAGAGLVLGLAQQWRGAHFMSHTLWSAALCWSVAHAVHTAWPRAWAAEGI